MSTRETTRNQAIFGDDYHRTSGATARHYNLLAARLIAELVKNSLGPSGLEKLLTDILGEATLTKDGAAILRKIDVEHPAAKAVIDAANSVDNEVGDGTITVVVLAGALLEKAEQMINSGIPPASIIDGYLISLETALATLKEISYKVENTDEEVMLRLVDTCLDTKVLSAGGSTVAKMIVSAVKAVADFSRHSVSVDDIKIEEKPGNISSTELVTGLVIDKTVDSAAMPKKIEHAKILLINDELENKATRASGQINITRPNQIVAFKHREMDLVKSKVDHIIDSGANVVISRQGINGFAQELLARACIMSVKRVKENDLLWLAKATGAQIAGNLDHKGEHHHNHEHPHGPMPHLDRDQNYRHGDIEVKLGYAERVYEKFVGDDRVVIIEGCYNPKAVTLLLRAESKKTLDECHRSAIDAISVLNGFVREPRIVTGGGSIEAAIANAVREGGKFISGKSQVAIEKFAEALEEIPITLARNSGMDVINALATLRSQHSRRTRDARAVNYGIDVKRRRVANLFPSVIEPVVVKEQVMISAVEVANLILRVDDVLMAKPALYTHTHDDGTQHSHKGGNKEHRHDYFDRLGKSQRPAHHYY